MALRLASIFSSEVSPAAGQAAPATERAWEIQRLRSGGRWPESLASFDPDTCCWRTSQTSLLSNEGPLGERFSATWPRSGMSLRGTVYPLPPLVPRTSAIGSSPLLATPTAWLGRRGSHAECNDPERWYNPERSNELSDQIATLLPTPPSQAARNSPPLTHALLPTPNASLQNYEEDTDQFLARREKLKERHGNGNGIGLPLGVAMRMLPTPTTGDSKQARNKTSGRREGSQHHDRTTLTDFAYETSGASTREPSPDGSKSPAPLLSPYFVEWMLGLPAGWSDPDCPLSATAFSSKRGSSSADASSTTSKAA